MSGVVNLNLARKAEALARAKAQAAENRVRFGLSKTAKSADADTRRKLHLQLDGAKREP